MENYFMTFVSGFSQHFNEYSELNHSGFAAWVACLDEGNKRKEKTFHDLFTQPFHTNVQLHQQLGKSKYDFFEENKNAGSRVWHIIEREFTSIVFSLYMENYTLLRIMSVAFSKYWPSHNTQTCVFTLSRHRDVLLSILLSLHLFYKMAS